MLPGVNGQGRILVQLANFSTWLVVDEDCIMVFTIFEKPVSIFTSGESGLKISAFFVYWRLHVYTMRLFLSVRLPLTFILITVKNYVWFFSKVILSARMLRKVANFYGTIRQLIVYLLSKCVLVVFICIITKKRYWYRALNVYLYPTASYNQIFRIVPTENLS